ncbi:MAG: protein kinase [Planctomycetota bacterium]
MSPDQPDRPELELIAASADRSLFRCRRADGGFECVKRYETGSLNDATQEFHFGRVAAGPGVVEMLSTTVDPVSGRPELRTAWVEGEDLQTRLTQGGALTSALAAKIGAALCRVLARLHDVHRIAHGDVKPANVMVSPHTIDSTVTVTLLDFEHARPIGDSLPRRHAAARFAGGTHGYSAPECYDGAPPSAAADIFSLGCLLAAMVCGTAPFLDLNPDAIARRAKSGRLPARWRLDGCNPRWLVALEACLSPVPLARPSAHQLAEDLERIAAHDDSDRERVRQAALAGELDPRNLERVSDAKLRRRYDRRVRVRASATEPSFVLPRDLDAGVEVLRRSLRRLHAHCRILPRDPRLTAWRADAVHTTVEWLPKVPAAIAERRRAGDPIAAARLCEAALDVARIAPRGLPPDDRGGQRLLQRDPAAYFERQRLDLEAAVQSHRRVLARMDKGIASGNLDEIDGAIGEFSAMYGGSSTITAAMRDRRHRLEFYLSRIGALAHATEVIARLLNVLGTHADLSAVESLRDRAAPTERAASPRGLLRALTEIESEFPAIASRLRPARQAVHDALSGITAAAWGLVRDAERKLSTPPIPIRPLADLMDRVDSLRESDVFVDGPLGTRSALYDSIEIVRTRLDQARAERDRLTSGARDALDRGHITTAIFDMERAVDRFGDAHPDEDDGLAAEYERARERKRELERLHERNHELAARYGRLLGEPGATPHERLAVLRDRESALTQLAEWLGPERGKPYAEDLVDVKRELLLETAQDGERRFLAARNDDDRRLVAQRTFDALLHALPDSTHDQPTTEARDILEVWSTRLDSSGGVVRRRTGEVTRGSRWPFVTIGVAIALIAAGVAWWLFGRAERSPQAELQAALATPVAIERADSGIAFDSARAVAYLREFSAVLEDLQHRSSASAARAVADAVDRIDAGRGHYADVKTAVQDFQRGLPAELSRTAASAAAEFSRRALRAAIATAIARGEKGGLREVLELDVELRGGLSLADAEALDRALGY